MASQQDLQELLRLITTRKVPMMTAMTQVKALQAVKLRSIQQIADALPDLVESALGDVKAAKTLQSACTYHLGRGANKRVGDFLAKSNGAKQPRVGKPLGNDGNNEPAQQTAEDFESSLALPIVMNEKIIAETSVHTNRAPLMLAFVVELLRFTMPGQPLSSRLSLAQAVVSANSTSRAANLGLAGIPAKDGSWSKDQPKVTIMGRSITVLKRGDYQNQRECHPKTVAKIGASTQKKQGSTHTKSSTWTTSSQITVKSSTFVARVANLDHPSQAATLIRSLMSSQSQLQTASHNAWGYRVNRIAALEGQGGTGEAREACEDDGEAGCGEFILRMMREVGVINAVVVLTRWFGGEMLGTDRWRLMRSCVTEALSERLRLPPDQVGDETVALWAIDLQSMIDWSGGGIRDTRSPNHWNHTMVGAATYRPDSARAYLLKSFSSGQETGKHVENGSKAKLNPRKMTKTELESEKLQNLGRLLGSLRLLFESWAAHLTPLEMDRRAWTWYAAVRPGVNSEPSAWGAKGWLNLSSILELRREDKEEKG